MRRMFASPNARDAPGCLPDPATLQDHSGPDGEIGIGRVFAVAGDGGSRRNVRPTCHQYRTARRRPTPAPPARRDGQPEHEPGLWPTLRTACGPPDMIPARLPRLPGPGISARNRRFRATWAGAPPLLAAASLSVSKAGAASRQPTAARRLRVSWVRQGLRRRRSRGLGTRRNDALGDDR